jgi:hypothetical protein
MELKEDHRKLLDDLGVPRDEQHNYSIPIDRVCEACGKSVLIEDFHHKLLDELGVPRDNIRDGVFIPYLSAIPNHEDSLIVRALKRVKEDDELGPDQKKKFADELISLAFEVFYEGYGDGYEAAAGFRPGEGALPEMKDALAGMKKLFKRFTALAENGADPSQPPKSGQ